MGLPLTGKFLPPQIALRFAEVAAPMNTSVVKQPVWGRMVADARNMLADTAIKLKAKYLFFWDEDVEMPPFALRELFYQLEHHPSWGVIGGIYVLKSEVPEPLVFKGKATGPYWNWKAGEVFECTGIGMGCTLIRTEVFKDLQAPWFRTVQDLDQMLDNVPEGTVWTEDLWFCNELTTKTKWKIYAHGGILCPHWDLTPPGKFYELRPDSKPMRHLLVPHGRKKIVDLGCGPNKFKTQEGKVVGVDIRDLPGVDYRCDLRKLPFRTGEFDIVYSSHTLEHFPRDQYQDVLKEWVRILKPAGELRLVLPNLTWAAKRILAGNTDWDTLNVLYGSQEYAENFHQTGFTDAMIRADLEKFGFRHVEITEQGLSLVVQATRTKPKKAKCPSRTKSNSKAGAKA